MEITKSKPGNFCWFELATSDQNGAKKFYGELFGWTASDSPMGPDAFYTMFQLRGKNVGAAYKNDQPGVPPYWGTYVAVAKVEESMAKAQSLGGSVVFGPVDVGEHGRLAVIKDPTGAMFNLWQPKEHIGVKINNEPGALCWSELTTRDPKKAEAFYTGMFGWSIKHAGEGTPAEYREFSVDGQPIGGIMETPKEVPANIPSYWMPYFQVANLDTAVSSATSNGGTLMIGPAPIPGTGRFAILTDPQGAMFAVFQRE